MLSAAATLSSGAPPARAKMSFSGKKFFKRELSALLLCEHSMCWLVAARPGDWSTIYVPLGTIGRLSPQPVWAAAVERWGSQLVELDPLAHPCVSVALIEGSAAYVELTARAVSTSLPVIAVLTHDHRHGLRCTLQWLQLRHQRLGGVTTFRVDVGLRSLPPPGTRTELHRTLGDIITHKHPVTPCLPTGPTCPHYKPTDRLTPGHFDRPCVFPTHRSCTQWGFRPLSVEELADAFDLPVWIQKNPALLSAWSRMPRPPLPPLKIFGHLLDHVVSSLERSPAPSALSIPLPSTPLQSSDVVPYTFLPAIGRPLPHSWIDDDLVSDKAAKGDDAQVHSQLWDKRITLVFPRVTPAILLTFRRCLFRRWCLNVGRSARCYIRTRWGSSSELRGGEDEDASEKETHEKADELTAIRRILSQNLASSWWDWDSGSALMFWRWHGREHQRTARLGVRVYVTDSLPQYHKAQKAPDKESRTRVAEKLAKAIERDYITPGPVKSLTKYHAVPKGDNDIRMVYDGTGCGLNQAVWAPSFWLPTADTALRMLTYSSFAVDVDLGEFFLNCPMDEDIQPYAGVDLTSIKEELRDLGICNKDSSETMWWRWNRDFMGFRPSPYNAIWHYYMAEEVARGDRSDPTNPCRFDEVRLNIIGQPGYDPSLPWLIKWNAVDQAMAGDLTAFVDDLRIAGYSRENAWMIARRICSRLQYLGIQDAPRKRRPPSQSPGAWAGSVQRISHDAISATTTEAKWLKGRTIIMRYNELMDNDVDPEVDLKQLQRDAGFLVHQTMTYYFMKPFLKGFFLTLNMWRPDRDEEGWKLQHRLAVGRRNADDGFDLKEEGGDQEPHMEPGYLPEWGKAAPRFRGDIAVLRKMYDIEIPPTVVVRSKHVLVVSYGFGDASGSGFGSAFSTGPLQFCNREECSTGEFFHILRNSCDKWSTQSE